VHAGDEFVFLFEHLQGRGAIRVMIRMETATYGESVSCTPMWAIGEPSGPIEKGTT